MPARTRFTSYDGVQHYLIVFKVKTPIVSDLYEISGYIQKQLNDADDVCLSQHIDQSWSTGEKLSPDKGYKQLVELTRLFVRGETYYYSDHQINGDYTINWENSNVIPEDTSALLAELNTKFKDKFEILTLKSFEPKLTPNADVIRRV